MIRITSKGDFTKTSIFLEKMKNIDQTKILRKYGDQCVIALKQNTPKDSGDTSNSWSYKIENNKNTIHIYFFNNNINKGVNIALILQYGHGTKNGGWVEGINYINPALQPLFDKIANEAWKEVLRI